MYMCIIGTVVQICVLFFFFYIFSAIYLHVSYFFFDSKKIYLRDSFHHVIRINQIQQYLEYQSGRLIWVDKRMKTWYWRNIFFYFTVWLIYTLVLINTKQNKTGQKSQRCVNLIFFKQIFNVSIVKFEHYFLNDPLTNQFKK